MIISKFVAITALVSVTLIGSASNTVKSPLIAAPNYAIELEYEYLSDDVRKDCAVKLDFELSDGSTIQGELTFSNVTWWECTKMQVAAWWERNF